MLLEDILEKAADGICVCHNIPYKPYVKFTHWNPRMTQITGYTLEEINELGWYQSLYPDQEIQQKAIERMSRMRKGNDIKAEEWNIVAKDKTKKTLSISTSIFKEENDEVHVLAIMQDITDRKKMEEELVLATAKYSTIFNQSVEGLYVHDVDGRIIDANEMACQQTGYPREELLKLNVLDFHVDTADSPKLSKDEVTKSWRERQPGEKVLILAAHKKKDGTLFPVQITSGAAYFGKTKYILAVVQDITERKRAEKEKNELAVHLQHAQKMESIGTLAGGIAHDFNNILLPIILHAEMAIDDLSPDNPLQQDIIEILKAAKRAKELVQQILTIARKKTEEKVVLKSSLLVKEIVKFLRSTIPTTIDIEYYGKTHQDTVLADPTQLNQIVMNLCTNAAHAMKDKGGLIKIILDNETLSNEKFSRFPGLKPGKYVKLSVEDTGTGIAPEIRHKIFEPYFTAKGVGEGTGLGLSIIHGIVKNYGGDIDFKSVLGEGTAFHVYLPFVEAEVTPKVNRSMEIPKGNERILFVDDEKPVVVVNKKILEKLGYTVTTETDSTAALEIFYRDPGAFDLVITDMTMPKMTGVELFHGLKKIKPDIPIIICTGYSDKIDEKAATKMGIDGYVNKPITGSEIAQIIREVLDNK